MSGEYAGWNGSRDFLGEGGEGKVGGIAWDSSPPSPSPPVRGGGDKRKELLANAIRIWWHRRLACADYNRGRDARPTSLFMLYGWAKGPCDYLEKSVVGCVLRTIKSVERLARAPAPPIFRCVRKEVTVGMRPCPGPRPPVKAGSALANPDKMIRL